jgi:hypothetical protein
VALDPEAIIDRDIDPRQRAQVGVLMAEIAECTGHVHVMVTPKLRRPPASREQHGYYRAVVLPIARLWMNQTQGGMPDSYGGFRDFTADEAHRWLKNELLGKPMHDPNTGEILSVCAPSCAKMNTKQMFQFTERVVDFLTYLGQTVPPPDKLWRERRDRAFAEEKPTQRKAG